MAEKIYIKVPFEKKDLAKQLGAIWDKEKKQWFFLPNSDLGEIYKWFPETIRHEIKYEEKDTDFDIPDDMALSIARNGITQANFNQVCEFLYNASLRTDMGTEHCKHCIRQQYKRIFPEFTDAQFYQMLGKWNPVWVN